MFILIFFVLLKLLFIRSLKRPDLVSFSILFISFLISLYSWFERPDPVFLLETDVHFGLKSRTYLFYPLLNVGNHYTLTLKSESYYMILFVTLSVWNRIYDEIKPDPYVGNPLCVGLESDLSIGLNQICGICQRYMCWLG